MCLYCSINYRPKSVLFVDVSTVKPLNKDRPDERPPLVCLFVFPPSLSLSLSLSLKKKQHFVVVVVFKLYPSHFIVNEALTNNQTPSKITFCKRFCHISMKMNLSLLRPLLLIPFSLLFHVNVPPTNNHHPLLRPPFFFFLGGGGI